MYDLAGVRVCMRACVVYLVPNIPTGIGIPVNYDLVGTFLVPMRTTAYKSYRKIYLENLRMQNILGEGYI